MALQEDPKCSGIPGLWEKIGNAGMRILHSGCGGWNGNGHAGNSPKTSTEWFNPKSHWQVPGKAQNKFRSESKLYNLRFKSSLGCRIKFPTVPGKGRNCVGSICGISASLSLK